MLIHQLPLDAAFATLRSVPAGLSQADAAARRLEFGPNRIERLARTPLTVRFLRQFTHFFAALLWVAALLALIADWWMPGQGMAMLAAAIVAVIAINGAFSFWQEYRAEETMAALQRLLPHQVRALRNGTTVALPSEGVVPGDVIFLSAGDDVPADCRLVEAFGVRVSNATARERFVGWRGGTLPGRGRRRQGGGRPELAQLTEVAPGSFPRLPGNSCTCRTAVFEKRRPCLGSALALALLCIVKPLRKDDDDA